MHEAGIRSARRSWCWLMVLATNLLGGCYTYQYLPETPAPGTSVAVELTDLGRLQLENNVGPDVMQVEGTLASVAESTMTLQVARTRNLRGNTQPWAGEPVTLRTGQYRMMRERRFSTPRTAVLVGTLTAGFVAFATSRGLLGLGNSSSGGGENPPPPNQ